VIYETGLFLSDLCNCCFTGVIYETAVSVEWSS